MTTTNLQSILAAERSSGLAHNGGAGGQYLLCAAEQPSVEAMA